VSFYVYILASQRNGTIYVGSTDDLVRRIWQHRNNLIAGFTQQHGVKTLVWYEGRESRGQVLLRERQLKKWNRSWKLAMIEKENPRWRDLWSDITP
jgi:putative endonuclease